jgi:protoporphyrin/coproporphyrin ferrochelatase
MTAKVRVACFDTDGTRVTVTNFMKKILLINLGGPQTGSEIEKFLLDLFEDPFLFDLPLPEFFRLRLARWIAKRRAPKVFEIYKEMGLGGGSPLVAETWKQAVVLEKRLIEKTGETWKVNIAMNCGFPNVRDLPKEELIPNKNNWIIPLFPHFSRSTTLSTANIIQQLTQQNPIGKVGWVDPFYHNPKFIQATTQLIIEYFTGKLTEGFIYPDKNLQEAVADWQNVPILFSAHGIPMRLVKKGDTYPKEIYDHSYKIETELRKHGYKGEVFLSYQSRVGPSKWTSPSTIDKLKELGSKGYKQIAVYPISFVSDHLETIVEIGRELKEVAQKHGIETYYRIPAMGTYSLFIDCLADLVMQDK